MRHGPGSNANVSSVEKKPTKPLHMQWTRTWAVAVGDAADVMRVQWNHASVTASSAGFSAASASRRPCACHGPLIRPMCHRCPMRPSALRLRWSMQRWLSLQPPSDGDGGSVGSGEFDGGGCGGSHSGSAGFGSDGGAVVGRLKRMKKKELRSLH